MASLAGFAQANEADTPLGDEAPGKALGGAKQFGGLGLESALIIDGTFDKNFELSARNINHVSLLSAAGLNVYDIMRSKKLVLTKAAITAIEERLA